MDAEITDSSKEINQSSDYPSGESKGQTKSGKTSIVNDSEHDEEDKVVHDEFDLFYFIMHGKKKNTK